MSTHDLPPPAADSAPSAAAPPGSTPPAAAPPGATPPNAAAPQAGEPRPTPLRAVHERLGATMTGFAGWLMPLRYGSAIA